MKTINKYQAASPAGGFTLIEVVVAMSIFAIGILGLASLQATSLKTSAGTLARSQASSLANSIIDAMRAYDLTQLTDYAHDFIDPPPVCQSELDLSGNTIPEQDLGAWDNELACKLPQGEGSIAVVGQIITVTIRWDAAREQTATEAQAAIDNDTPTTQTFMMSTRL